MRRVMAAVFATALGTLVVTGCSDNNDNPLAETTSTTTASTQTSDSVPESSSTSTSSAAGPSDLRAQCAGVTSDDLAPIFSTGFAVPTASSGGVSTVDDFDYKTVGCSFESADEELEVDINLSFAEQFEDGTVHCMKPSDHVHPVVAIDGLGDSAWWQPNDFENSTDAEGELTVCVAEAMIGIDIEGPAELRATLQQQANDVARLMV